MIALSPWFLWVLRPSSLLVGSHVTDARQLRRPCGVWLIVGAPLPVSSRVEMKRSGLTSCKSLIRKGLLCAASVGAAHMAHPPFISEPGPPMGPNYYRLEKWEGVRGNLLAAGVRA